MRAMTLEEANQRIEELEAKLAAERRNVSLFGEVQVQNLRTQCDDKDKTNAALSKRVRKQAKRINDLSCERAAKDIESKFHATLRKALTDAVIAEGYNVIESLDGTVKLTAQHCNQHNFRQLERQFCELSRQYHDATNQSDAEIKRLSSLFANCEKALKARVRDYNDLVDQVRRLKAGHLEIVQTILLGRDILIAGRDKLRTQVRELEVALASEQLIRVDLQRERKLKEGVKPDAKIKELEESVEGLQLRCQGYSAANAGLINTAAVKDVLLDQHRAKIKELEETAKQLRVRVDVLITEKGELEEALANRIKEVKMLRGYRKKERDEKVEALEAKVAELKEKLKERKNMMFGALYGKDQNREIHGLKQTILQLEVEIKNRKYDDQLTRKVNEQIQNTCRNQTVEITRLNGLVKYHKVTTEKRLAAVRTVQELRDGDQRAALDFCKWIESLTGADGYRGHNVVGKLVWAKEILTGRIR